MAEEQVTVGKHTIDLEKLFMVMATQNPIEQEGTYPLPEAQLDRFMLHIVIDYPSKQSELEILDLVENEARKVEYEKFEPVSQADLFTARDEILNLHMSEDTKNYLVELVVATRQAGNYSKQLGQYIEYGVSPRATLALSRCARAYAWLNGQDFVTPDDVQAVVHDVFRHRLLVSFEGEAAGKNVDNIVDELLTLVPVI